jgi:hypothetical protein
MAIIEGICREEFRAVRDVFEYHLDSGIDVGASVAVFIDGSPSSTCGAATSTPPTPGPGNATPSCRRSRPPRP